MPKRKLTLLLFIYAKYTDRIYMFILQWLSLRTSNFSYYNRHTASIHRYIDILLRNRICLNILSVCFSQKFICQFYQFYVSKYIYRERDFLFSLLLYRYSWIHFLSPAVKHLATHILFFLVCHFRFVFVCMCVRMCMRKGVCLCVCFCLSILQIRKSNRLQSRHSKMEQNISYPYNSNNHSDDNNSQHIFSIQIYLDACMFWHFALL